MVPTNALTVIHLVLPLKVMHKALPARPVVLAVEGAVLQAKDVALAAQGAVLQAQGVALAAQGAVLHTAVAAQGNTPSKGHRHLAGQEAPQLIVQPSADL